MATSKTKYGIWFTALVIIMACAPTFAAPSVPTTDPNAIGTIIAQTANVAASQTEAALPTFTPTITFTPTPRNTHTPEPTATNTVIFHFYSPTAFVTRTATVVGATGSGNSLGYACSVLSVNPTNGTVYATRADFDVTWRVKNTGQKKWELNSVDYVYLSGDKFYKIAGYDLHPAVPVGGVADLVVNMTAPKNPGTYTTNWTMRASANYFCTMSLTIKVQ